MKRHLAALIRHGAYAQAPDTPSALQPHPLTSEGVDQAWTCGHELADLLSREGWHLNPVAYCSAQLRAWQTGTLALEVLQAAGFRVDLVQDERLSERSLGSAANLTVAQIEAVLDADPRFDAPPPGWKSQSDYQLPLQGAESLMSAGTRVARCIQQRISAAPAPRETTLTLFFGHGASFRHAAHHLGVLEREQIAQISMYHARPLLLCYKENGTWVHCSGTWKPRGKKDVLLD